MYNILTTLNKVYVCTYDVINWKIWKYLFFLRIYLTWLTIEPVSKAFFLHLLIQFCDFQSTFIDDEYKIKTPYLWWLTVN